MSSLWGAHFVRLTNEIQAVVKTIIQAPVGMRCPFSRSIFDAGANRVCLTGMKSQASPGFTILVSILFLAVTSCSKPQATENAEKQSPTPSAAPEAKFDACALLTKEEIQAVQGEAFTETKPSHKSAGGLSVAQCYFQLPTASNSIVINVTQKAEGGRAPGESWKEMFHSEKAREKEEGEEERKGPLVVEGIGDEAFWTGTRVGGALYVLKGDCYLRISVGGAGDQAQKIEKSKTLAASALKRL